MATQTKLTLTREEYEEAIEALANRMRLTTMALLIAQLESDLFVAWDEISQDTLEILNS
jgi:hypothetical protein